MMKRMRLHRPRLRCGKRRPAPDKLGRAVRAITPGASHRSERTPAGGALERAQRLGHRINSFRVSTERRNAALNQSSSPSPVRVSQAREPVVQRVIAGLETYTDHKVVPESWAVAYLADLTDSTTHLTDEHLLQIYRNVRGRTPDQDHMVFRHVGGNHWTLIDNRLGDGQSTTYQIEADGSCGLHAVHLAIQLLAGREQDRDPNIPYSAPDDFITTNRRLLQEYLTDEERQADSVAEARRLIALGIHTAEFVFTTGFGPRLQTLLRATLVERSPETMRQFFNRFYELYWPQTKLVKIHWPKPSEAKKLLKKEFFTKGSLRECVVAGLNMIFENANGVKNLLEEDDSKVAKVLDSNLRENMSADEAAAWIKSIPSLFKLKKPIKKRLDKKQYRTGSKEQLRKKLANPTFRAKILKASRMSRLRFKKSSKSHITKLIQSRNTDLTKIEVSTQQLMEALFAFTGSESGTKNDLKVGTGDDQYTSIGQGGLQVKGLGTYPQEVIWFQDKISKWGVNPKDVFRALQLRDIDALKNITKDNPADLKHLLSFHTLQIEEIFRGVQFAIGQAAHYRLAFHGQKGVQHYLTMMPMYEEGATTNVTKTEDPSDPFDPDLWQRQENSMFEGLCQLANLDIPQGEIYDERTLNYIHELEREPIDTDPSDQLVEAGYEFMQSPNPYLNQDEEDAGSDDGGSKGKPGDL